MARVRRTWRISAREGAIALDALMYADDDSAAQSARFLLLFAVGNTHAGIVFPAAVGIVDPLARIALSSGPEARRFAGLESLIDIVASSQPLEDFNVVEVDGKKLDLQSALELQLARHLASFAGLAVDARASDRLRSSARELIDALNG